MVYKRVNSEQELQLILDLQWENHKSQISDEEKKSQGFLTVRHSLEELSYMHAIEPSVLAMSDNILAAYVIAMTTQSRNVIPALVPMFEMFDNLTLNYKKLSTYTYMVVGQVCVSKNFRGKNVFSSVYEAYKNFFKEKFDFAITEIATNNLRSMKAHQKLGFETIETYTDEFDIEWNIVVWQWND
jgi:hypothetical protein